MNLIQHQRHKIRFSPPKNFPPAQAVSRRNYVGGSIKGKEGKESKKFFLLSLPSLPFLLPSRPYLKQVELFLSQPVISVRQLFVIRIVLHPFNGGSRACHE